MSSACIRCSYLDVGPPLDGLQVPGVAEQVTPVAPLREESRRCVEVLPAEAGLEVRQPRADHLHGHLERSCSWHVHGGRGRGAGAASAVAPRLERGHNCGFRSVAVSDRCGGLVGHGGPRAETGAYAGFPTLSISFLPTSTQCGVRRLPPAPRGGLTQDARGADARFFL